MNKEADAAPVHIRTYYLFLAASRDNMVLSVRPGASAFGVQG